MSLVLTAALLLVAGCGSSTKPPTTARPEGSAPTNTNVATPAPTKEKLNASLAVGGTKNSLFLLTPMLAKYSNYFDEEGVNMDVQELKGGAQAAQALVSGQVNFAAMALDHAVKSQAQGVDLVVVALMTRFPTVTIVVDSKLKDKVKTPKDLKGLKIGITSPGSGSHAALLSLLDKFGLKPTDVEIAGVGTSGMPAALESGQIQAAANYDPYITQVVQSGKAFVLWDLRTEKDTKELYGDEYPFVGLVTRREVLTKNPDLVERVVKAIVRSNRYLTTSNAEAIAARLPKEIKGEDDALYTAALKSNLEAFAGDSLATDRGLQVVINSLKKDKVIPDSATVTPATLFDGSIVRKVSK
jgi:NitT/TauT family transport system substrate-binding protein